MYRKWKKSVNIFLAIALLEILFFLPSYFQQKGYALKDFILPLYRQSSAVDQTSENSKAEAEAPFTVYQETTLVGSFEDAREAIAIAKAMSPQMNVKVQTRESLIWRNFEAEPKTRQLSIVQAPHISQLPELPRGCEVTALAMLLNYNGYAVDKMQLASELVKDTTPRTSDDKNNTWWGNPYKGFVGNMYDVREPGFGVFHPPIEALARTYAGERVVNLSTLDFDDILQFVESGYPVWVIVTRTYQHDNTRNLNWMTPDGPIHTTRNEHSVLLTGYDGKYVYFLDPLKQGETSKKSRVSFEAGWKQLGNQAITIL
ncbi:C39 family peptidase [Brevibacillus ruminantium]|uniref:C39 family peptidase n=1 Tax=Brevibacillus ruminantium TaxID=2950604 RepID=A0ABY4WM29_9BACL|nr:C39 family peptidase [Brevibacillus ruminantium]USG65666.1 C39 family peptidase [Brevibacillus ruminantium]